MNTAELLVSMLEQAGVRYIFGVPGGAIEDLNTALAKSRSITPIVSKHEEGAAFMADGYARVSGRLGVCCSTAGPGSTNLLTGLGCSCMSSVPVLALTGQVATSLLGRGAIQEAGPENIDIVGIYSRLTKYSSMLQQAERAPYVIGKTLQLATSVPTGPVHLNMPADVMKQQVSPLPPCRVVESRLHPLEDLAGVAEHLLRARRPVILAGWGTVLSRSGKSLRRLAETLAIPVATTPKAKGIFPESHSLALGGVGFAGSPVAKAFFQQRPDLLLAVGTSFNEMATSGWDQALAPEKHLIHITANRDDLNRNYPTDIGILGDAATSLAELVALIQHQPGNRLSDCRGHRRDLPEEISRLRRQQQDDSRPEAGGDLYHPARLVTDIQEAMGPDALYFVDIGNTMAWALRHMTMDRPYSFYVPLGFGSMGYGVAAAVGGKLAAPERPVVSLVGDGAFQMNGFEVACAVNYQIPVIWVVFNNGMLGMVYHGRRLFATPVPEGIPSRFSGRVDFAKIAEGLGAQGIRLTDPGSFTPELVGRIMDSGRPTVVDVWIDAEVVPPIHSRIKTVDEKFQPEPAAGQEVAA